MITLSKKLQEHLIQALSTQSEVKQAILFGSRARGDAEARSDIDLAIVAPDASHRQWLDIVYLVEEVDTLLPIDIVRWEEAPTSLQQRILTEGKILYERETEPEFN